ncbi:neutral zinc metallopeptidase [Methyloglobulus sp.]|uniref:neutral zinc metallopeptidase n=1 Tax=Methyloglobulus sp. TaxID=2518622 RepID=UPI00398A0F6E
MRQDDGRESDNIEDRRSMGVGRRGFVGGGLGVAAMAIVALLLGVDPRIVLNTVGQLSGGSQQSAPVASTPQDERKGVAIFAKACFWHPSPSKRQKLNATANACGCPSRSSRLRSGQALLPSFYTQQGVSNIGYAMTRRDVGMLCIFTTQKNAS